MGVVVRRYIDILIIIITFPYSTCIRSFFGSNIPISLFIFKMFFRFCLCYFVQYSKSCSKEPEHSRLFKNRDHANMAIIDYVDKNVERTSTVCTRESRDFHVRGTA